MPYLCIFYSFFFNDPATTEIYTLSLHDALPICASVRVASPASRCRPLARGAVGVGDAAAHQRQRATGRGAAVAQRSEEHTSELQSQFHLVCRLLLEKKKKKKD